jgi:hypothetical protein
MAMVSSNRKENLISLPVIEGYYLVLGGGKIGTSFKEYAKKHRLPFVLIIDYDRNAPASSSTEIIKDINSLGKILGNISKLPKSQIEKENSEICFLCTGLESFPYILSFGIPEYIVPAIPCHVAAYTVKNYLNYVYKDGQVVSELSISSEDEHLLQFFEDFTGSFPENIVAGIHHMQGILMLSYAKSGEICPDNCAGPEKFCPTFKRYKPETITNYVKYLFPYIKGWVFESYQIEPGIGAIKGVDVKDNLLQISEYIHSLKICDDKITNMDIKKQIFFIATTCNCHGVVNLLRIDFSKW